MTCQQSLKKPNTYGHTLLDQKRLEYENVFRHDTSTIITYGLHYGFPEGGVMAPDNASFEKVDRYVRPWLGQ